MANNQFDYTHKQINSLEPVTFKSITSSDLIDYQSHDLEYDLKIDQLLDQLRDLMPDQTHDQSPDQL
jgi:hypothetical protein